MEEGLPVGKVVGGGLGVRAHAGGLFAISEADETQSAAKPRMPVQRPAAPSSPLIAPIARRCLLSRILWFVNGSARSSAGGWGDLKGVVGKVAVDGADGAGPVWPAVGRRGRVAGGVGDEDGQSAARGERREEVAEVDDWLAARNLSRRPFRPRRRPAHRKLALPAHLQSSRP